MLKGDNVEKDVKYPPDSASTDDSLMGLMSQLAALIKEANSGAVTAEPLIALLESKIDTLNQKIDDLYQELENEPPETAT